MIFARVRPGFKVRNACDAEGNITSLLGITRDQTRRKQAEEIIAGRLTGMMRSNAKVPA